jgi:hypothetical protein
MGTRLGGIGILAAAILAAACGSAARGADFPSFVYASADSLAAYKTAVANRTLLLVLPCYCGCGESAQHRNLEQCFFKPEGGYDSHASGCDICGKEAMDAARWQRDGMSAKEIRRLIDEKYAVYGTPTDTAPVRD